MHHIISLSNKSHSQIKIAALFIALTAILTVSGLLPYVSALLIIVLAFTLVVHQHLLRQGTEKWLLLLWVLLILVSITLGMYRPNTFTFPLIFSAAELHPKGKPFSLHINTAKTLAGYLIFFLVYKHATSMQKSYINDARLISILITTSAFLILAIAFFTLQLSIHLKPITFVWQFALVNLLSTCLAEEAFMRLIIHAQLIHIISNYSNKRCYNEGIPLLLTTLIFTATHYTPSLSLLCVYTLAGLFYGLTYTLTKNIYATIAAHFLINILHFTFLTYPI